MYTIFNNDDSILNDYFKYYGNQYESVQGIPFDLDFIKYLRKQNKKKGFVSNNYIFIFSENYTKLRIYNLFYFPKYIVKLNDYIVRDKTGIYVLSKDKFENVYKYNIYKE